MDHPPQQAGYVQHWRVVRDQNHNDAVIVIAWVLAALTIGYMLPWAVAATRGKSNQGAIAVLNLLVGWTVIGWIVALVMAFAAHPTGIASFANQMPMQQQGPPPPGWYPAPDGSGAQAYWNGQAWEEQQPSP